MARPLGRYRLLSRLLREAGSTRGKQECLRGLAPAHLALSIPDRHQASRFLAQFNL